MNNPDNLFIVTNTNNFGAGSLRDAIAQANSHPGADTIIFDLPANSKILTTSSLLLTDSAQTTINGSDVVGLTISGSGSIFRVDVGASAILNGLTVNDGSSFSGGLGSPPARGGGIYNDGNLTVTNSTISGNRALVGASIGSSGGLGGGIYNSVSGSLSLSNSTLFGNVSAGGGGGIFNAGNLTVTNSTISGNSAVTGNPRAVLQGYGGGIYNTGNLTVSNSILSGNSADLGGREIFSSTPVISGGYNLFGFSSNSGLNGVTTVTGDISPSVGLSQILSPTLANNGGTTQTLALVAGSPAVNAGNNPGSLTTDQRGIGFNRIEGGKLDIGSFESSFAFPVTLAENSANGTLVGTVTAVNSQAGSLTYAITTGNSDPDGDGNLAFAINTNTGIIIVNDSGDLDFETTPQFNLQVTATNPVGLSSTSDATVTLLNINDAPVGKDLTVSTLRNTAYTFFASDFGFSDRFDAFPNSLLAVKIDTLPTQGRLTYNGLAVVVGQFISASDINSGLLQFTPDANAKGLNYAIFNFQVQDDGGTVNGGIDLDQTPNTLTINVTSILVGQGGALDPTFGIGGIVTTDFFGPFDSDSNVIVQSDGKVLIIGSPSNNSDFLLSRYNSNGSLDAAFGTNGKATTDFGGIDDSNSVTLQSDGKIVVVGFTDNFGADDFALSRYNSDGSSDSTFGTNGTVTTNFGGFFNVARSVKQQSDGKLVVAGTTLDSSSGSSYNFALSRYNSDGSLDSSFGTNGKVTTDFNGSDDSASSIALQSDSKIIVAGSTFTSFGNFTSALDGYDFALSRYNSDGSLDTTFGNNGKVMTDFGSNDGGKSVTLQSDGKIIVAGSAGFYSNSNANFALSRYNSDGSLDTTFGTNGKVTTDFNGSIDIGQSVKVQSDGKVIVSGTTLNSFGNYDFALSRYNTDGSLDTTFGTNGKITTDISGSDDYAPGAALQSDGKIILAGNSGSSVAIARYLTANIITDAINDEPLGADNTVTTVANTAYTFTASDFKFSDPNDIPSNNLLAVKIATLPTNGSLTNKGIAVNAGDFVSAADIAAGNLQFTPVANAKGLGYANFTFQVQDDGGTANGGIDLDQTPNTITIDVASSGSSNGDPHITTFDGLHYDFQAQGDFTLVKATDSDLNIQVRQSAWTLDPATTLNTGLATVLDGKKLEFSIDQPLPLVDGVSLTLGVGESQALGNGSISRSSINGYGTQGDLYTITYGNGDRLLVNVFENFLIDPTVYLKSSQNVVGLLGNNNGQTEDDLALQDGTVSAQAATSEYLLSEFATSWQVANENSLFREQPLPAGSKLVVGTAGNDALTGGVSNDVLVGMTASSLNFGTGEIDQLTGSQGADTFVLGNRNSSFYAGAGVDDYALIQDFNAQVGDIIQLKGSANDYALGFASTGQASGTGIFLSSNPNELIGIIGSIRPQELSLSQPSFQYV
jgi:uncharacterized delta-60 repeat protein